MRKSREELQEASKAKLKRHRDNWKAKAEGLQQENTELRRERARLQSQFLALKGIAEQALPYVSSFTQPYWDLKRVLERINSAE